MTIDPQALNLKNATTSFNGMKVVTSNQSATLSLTANALVTATVSSQAVPVTLAGVNISSAYTNGTAAVAATTTLTFDDDIESTSLSTDPYVQFTDAGGQTRTYFGVTTLGVSGSATFTFDKAAAVNTTITLISYMDGVSTTVIFKAAAQGTTNGSTSGGFTLFAVDDADTSGAATSAFDAAANLVAAINSANGLPDLEAYANRVSDTDATLANGKVYLKARDADDSTNTAIVTAGDVAGTATFTLTDKPNEGDTITLVDTDGTSVVFEIDDTEDGVTGSNIAVTEIAENGGGGTGTAVDLVAKINAQASLDITATNPSTGRVNLVQGATGSASNKTITVNDTTRWNAACSVNVPAAFTGGTAFTDSTNVNPPGAFTSGVDETVDITKNKWSRKGSAENAAESLKDAINDTSSGQGYTDGLTATRSGAVLTIVQDVAGAAGNTAVTYNKEFQEISTVLPRDFTGGAAAATPSLGIQYSTNGTDWTPTVTIAADVAANVTGIKLFTLPESVTSYPAFRLVFNSDLSTAGTTGQLSFVGAY